MNRFQGPNKMLAKFPTIDISSILNPAGFCRSANKSIDGTKAAMDLQKVRKGTLDLLRSCQLSERAFDPYRAQRKKRARMRFYDEFQLSISKTADEDKLNKEEYLEDLLTSASKPFLIDGHGIPYQLIDDHQKLCRSFLTYYGAHMVRFSDFGCSLSIRQLHIYSRDGRQQLLPWPPTFGRGISDEYEHRLKLYLTVMNRISVKLNSALSSHDGGTGVEPKHWDVCYMEESFYPGKLLGMRTQPIVEVIEERGNDSKKVRVTLQDESRSNGQPISLIFNSYFYI